MKQFVIICEQEHSGRPFIIGQYKSLKNARRAKRMLGTCDLIYERKYE